MTSGSQYSPPRERGPFGVTMTLHPYWYYDNPPADDYWVTKYGRRIGKPYPSWESAVNAMHHVASEDEEREGRTPYSMPLVEEPELDQYTPVSFKERFAIGLVILYGLSPLLYLVFT